MGRRWDILKTRDIAVPIAVQLAVRLLVRLLVWLLHPLLNRLLVRLVGRQATFRMPLVAFGFFSLVFGYLNFTVKIRQDCVYVVVVVASVCHHFRVCSTSISYLIRVRGE